MARRTRSREKGPLWHGYRRPVWRDGVFWLALGTSIAGLLVQNAFGDFHGTGADWAILGLEVLITFGIVFALIGVLAGTLRGFGEGWRQAENTAAPREAVNRPTPPGASTPTAPRAEPARPAEPVAQSSPVVEPEPEPAPEPTVEVQPEPERDAEPAPSSAQPAASDRPKAGVEMERHARRLGRAIGAGRRTYKKYDKS